MTAKASRSTRRNSVKTPEGSETIDKEVIRQLPAAIRLPQGPLRTTKIPARLTHAARLHEVTAADVSYYRKQPEGGKPVPPKLNANHTAEVVKPACAHVPVPGTRRCVKAAGRWPPPLTRWRFTTAQHY